MLFAFCLVAHASEIKQGIQKLPQINEDAPELTFDQFSYGLLGDLKNVSGDILISSREQGIDPILVASIAALESGWNTSFAANEYNNLFGWTNNDGTYRQFDSKSECIDYVCQMLKEHYLTPDGKYFEGYEIADICVHYNGQEEWTHAVEEIYSQIKQRIGQYNYYKIVNIALSYVQNDEYMI